MWTGEGNDTALVAIVPRKSDWEILMAQHWYRIPVASAPEMTTKVRFLAFYQPKIFGDERYAVNYYTEVKGLETKKRIELLPDEPCHPRAQTDYYKFTVGELIRLPKPIPSQRWRRITFIPTTLSKLMAASEINELYCTSPIEEKLYEYLKREKISAERQFFVYETEEPYCLDLAIFCRDGNLDVECDGEAYHSAKEARIRDRRRDNELTSIGWLILRFSGREISEAPKSCLNQIKRAIRSLNGIDTNKKIEST